MAQEGDRLQLIRMADDPCPIVPGTKGTVAYVDDAGTLHVDWDDGRTLGLLPGLDVYQVIEAE